jgi:hypothetical protein
MKFLGYGQGTIPGKFLMLMHQVEDVLCRYMLELVSYGFVISASAHIQDGERGTKT